MPYLGAKPTDVFADRDLNGAEFILDADADTSITADTDDQIDIRISGADDFAFKANKFEVQTGSNIDMNGTEFILDADGDTSITADTDDQIDFKVGGSDTLVLKANTVCEEWSKSVSGRAWKMTNAHASAPSGLLMEFSATAPDNNTQYFFYAQDSSAQRITIFSDGDIQNHDNSYGAISDEKLKQDISSSPSQWDDVKALAALSKKFRFISDVEADENAGYMLGLVAQDVELISPGLVKEHPDLDMDGNDLGTTTKAVQYSILYMKAVKALGEAMERIETLEKAVAKIEEGD